MLRKFGICLLASFATFSVFSAPFESDLPWMQEEVQSETGTETGILWMPIKEFVKSIPIGFSFCSQSINQETTISFSPEPFRKIVDIEDNCINVSYALFEKRTRLTIKTGNDSVFRIIISPKPGVAYKEGRFRIIRTDDQFFLTIIYDQKLPKDSKEAIICNHRKQNLVKVLTKPHGERDSARKNLEFTKTENPNCYRISGFPWQKGYWETHFVYERFDKIKLIDKVD